jgi:ATP-dependent Clp protease, protease subunit
MKNIFKKFNPTRLQISLAGLDQTSKVDEQLFVEQLNNRELFLGETVTDDVIYEIVHHVIRWNREDEGVPADKRKPIKLYINSYGGDVIACYSVIETMRASKTPIYTYNLGKAFSAGGLILMAGHKRFTYADAVVLIHQGSTGASGTTSQVIEQIEFQKRQEERIKAFILDVTNITPEQYKDKFKEEWFFFGDESVELGVTDEVIKVLP